LAESFDYFTAPKDLNKINEEALQWSRFSAQLNSGSEASDYCAIVRTSHWRYQTTENKKMGNFDEWVGVS